MDSVEQQTIRGTIIRVMSEISSRSDTLETPYIVSLMHYIDLDNLVDWFCEYVCEYDRTSLEKLVNNYDEAKAIVEFQNTSTAKGAKVFRGLMNK